MPRENRVLAAAPGLPSARLDDLHYSLALDATERPQAEREARSCLRAAMRQARRLMAEQIGGAA